MSISVPIIHVKLTGSSSLCVHRDVESIRIIRHGSGGPPGPLTSGYDGPSSDKHRNTLIDAGLRSHGGTTGLLQSLSSTSALNPLPEVLEEPTTLGGVLPFEWVPDLGLVSVGREVHIHAVCVPCDHRFDQKSISQHKGVIHVICGLILREFHPEWSHDGLTSVVGVVEVSVQIRHNGISGTDGRADLHHCCLTKEPRLTSLCVDVSMAPEEWSVCCRLVPSDKQFSFWVSKEAANISPTELDSSHTKL
mmetsp:Transcript_18589/g.28939  ORF Transcript_18589/g.28939 Transcript_18589/m.28939 type:complete len:249 (-) Transcript_18589:172-918(-)